MVVRPTILRIIVVAVSASGIFVASETVCAVPQSLVEREAVYSAIVDVPIPDQVNLEVGGLLALGGGQVLVSTRRGKVWRIDDFAGSVPRFRLFAEGLQEPLGLLRGDDGWIYVVQRTELSRMKDADGDGRCDVIEVVSDAWDISGSYHEYAFGPRRDGAGNLWVTLNIPFGDEPFGRVDWRGWAVRVTPTGKFEPVCGGLRSPAGIECSPDGEMFYTDNQGEWCGASKLSHLEVGDFHGHPLGIESAKRPESLVRYPGKVPDRIMMPEAAKKIPGFKLPAIWFPYDKMGKSPSGLVWDKKGCFGPFAGQVFVGDQHHAAIMRCFLETVNGRKQGACFPFRTGFDCGIIRLAWADDDSLLVGMSNRGWGSRGNRPRGLQRLRWLNEMPFEIRTMRVRPDGFRLEFTRPVDAKTASNIASWRLESYTYRLHSDYGSGEMDKLNLRVTSVVVAADRKTVDLRVNGLRAGGYVHELHADGVRDVKGEKLLHSEAYYTLVEMPRR